MNGLSKKHKTHSLTIYYRGIELELLCVTISKKRFAELSGESISSINNYGYSYDLRYPICNENPDILFGKVGLGGEGRYIFERSDIRPIEEMKKVIDEHRKIYLSYRDYLDKTNQ
jgi:hypothetical protein